MSKKIEWTKKELDELGRGLHDMVTAKPKKIYPIEKCDYCGKKYHQHRKKQRFCSDKCRFAKRDKERQTIWEARK